MEERKIAVFGASGMLGRRVIEAMCANETGKTHVIGFSSADCDITDEAAVVEAVGRCEPDVIVNCAAYTTVDKAESEPDTADRVNRLGAANIAKAAKKANSLLIHISTDYVFDGTSGRPYTEDMPTAPLGTYGRSKLLGEEAITASGCKHVIIRTQWLYDSGGKNFFLTMQRLMGERDKLNVVNDQTGSPTYAVDLAHAIATVAEKYDGQDGIYHFSNDGECTWYDFALSIAQLLNAKTKVNPIPTEQYPTPARRPHYSTLSKDKIALTFGVSVSHWRDGLNRCFAQWVMRHEGRV